MKRLFPVLFTGILFTLGVFNSIFFFLPGIILLFTFKKLRFTFNSCLVALIVVELILRNFAILPLHYRSFEVLNEEDPYYEDLFRLKPNSEIHMTEIGDLGAMSGNTSLQIKKEITTLTDDLGFRNSSDQRHKVNDFIFLGDSYSMGIALDQNQTIDSYLKESYNLGFPGDVASSTARYLCYRDQIKLKENHDVILLFFEGNDYYAGYIPHYKPVKRSWFQRKSSTISGFRKRSLLRNIYIRLRHNHFDKSSEQKVLEKNKELKYLQYEKELSNDNFNAILVKQNFDFLKKEVEQYSGKLSVAIIPSKSSYLKTDSRKLELMKILKELNIKTIDLKPSFKQKGLETRDLWWNDDTHFNPNGAKITAEILKSRL